MLVESEYNRAFTAARKDAETVLKTFITSEQFFQQDDRSRAGYARVIAHLGHFARGAFGVIIHQFDYSEVPGFASWLVRSGNGTGGIALYLTQIAAWSATGMPVHVQEIRSIIHEFGHLRLNPHILMSTVTPKSGSKPQRSDYATSREEELAWVYTGAFLGVILGDYSFNARENHRRDDAPRFFL